MKLAEINKHERDDRIYMDEPTHTYYINNETGYESVTQFISKFFPAFDADAVIKKSYQKWQKDPKSKYRGMSPEQIKKSWQKNSHEASQKGDDVHKAIENFYNREIVKCDKEEYNQFLKFHKEHEKELEPYRTEWMLFNEDLKLAGTIDMIYKDKDGNYVMIDWKTSKKIETENAFERGYHPIIHLEKCDFNKFALQLSIYKKFLQSKYDINVSKLQVVWLNRRNDDYKVIDLPFLDKEVTALFNERIKELYK